MRKYLSLFVAAIGVVGLTAVTAFALPVYVYNCATFGTCTLYVDDSYNGAPQPNGKIDTPFTSISDAVNELKNSSSYNKIKVAGGTYSESGNMPWVVDETDNASFYIYGGYNADFSEQNPAATPSVINLGGAKAFEIDDISGQISGFSFKGGSGSQLDPVIDINVSNVGGLNFEVSDNRFYDNVDFSGAVVIFSIGSSNGHVLNNMFYNNNYNYANIGNEYVVALLGSGEISGNIMYGNTSETLIGCADSDVFNNFLLDNFSGRAINAVGNCDVVHNTIAHNDIIGSADPAVVYMSSGGNMVVNNLIADNLGGDIAFHDTGDTSVFEYNALDGNSGDPVSPFDDNVLCDAQFVGSSTTNYEDHQLGANSDCLDTGDNLSMAATDYFGLARPADGDGDGNADSDPGAYEAPAANVAQPVITNAAVTINPFSPDGDGTADTTTFQFDVDVNAIVTAGVYDASGTTEIFRFIDGEAKSAGKVSYVWDGSDGSTTLPDGDYVIKYSASNAGGVASGQLDVEIKTEEETPDPDPQPQPGNECAGYSDVPSDHPDCDAIEYVQSIGAMTGNPDGTFGPNDLLQRDQVAKISLETYALFDSNDDYCNGSDPFPDVTPSQWSFQYICRGVDIDMITGYESGADAGFYRPAREVNRAEFLALILRNVNDALPNNSNASYNDVEAGQWYSGYAKYSMDNNLFEGSNLYPTQGTKRAEVADVIYKLHNLGKI